MKICAIGNATVDIQYQVDHQFLATQGFTPGLATYISFQQAHHIEKENKADSVMPGGAAANSLCGLAQLGAQCHFIGKRADDPMGDLFFNAFQRDKITFKTQPTDTDKGTGRCLTFTTHDGERSFAPYFGANHDLCMQDMDRPLFEACDLVLLEGYPLQGERGVSTLTQTADMIAQTKARLVFNPSDAGLVNKHKDTVSHIIQHTNILICNADEALALTGAKDTHDAALALSQSIQTGAVTIGHNGCLAFHKGHITHVPTTQPKQAIIDTNGAGDQFVAGFLFGLMRNNTIEEAAQLGHQQAAKVITQLGPRPS